MSLTLTVGDTAPTLTGNVNADLTGAAIAIHIKRADSTTFTRAGTIVTPATGSWSLALMVGDLTVSGTYWIEVQVTFSNGSIETFAKATDKQSTNVHREAKARLTSTLVALGTVVIQ